MIDEDPAVRLLNLDGHEALIGDWPDFGDVLVEDVAETDRRRARKEEVAFVAFPLDEETGAICLCIQASVTRSSATFERKFTGVAGQPVGRRRGDRKKA